MNWLCSLVRSNDLVIPALGWGRFATAGLTVTLALLVGLAELCLPSFPREKISEIESTLDYPPDGSATSAGNGRR
ncbi:MAG: hypothetical protein WB783_11930 [Arenicellales bacterium]